MSKTLEFSLPYSEDVDLYVKKRHPEVLKYRVVSKSLDARGAPKGRTPVFLYQIHALTKPHEEFSVKKVHPTFAALKQKPIIIGAGPAGLFCAVQLAEFGIPSIILERGASAQKRMLSIAKFWRHGELDPETNVCYGEGGAGLFSDGKLITRVKSPLVKDVMEKLVEFGAPEEIAYTSNPHLGSNKIREIISSISTWLISRGVEIRHNTRAEELMYQGNKVIGVKLSTGERLYSHHVVLATGHSAKEMYQHLIDSNVAMKLKDFAVGVRIEHPRKTVDQLQHGTFCAAPELGAARYRLSYHDQKTDRGTYSFCMCPGGYVLSSGTEKNGIVVNGMSNYARNSHWSNSALVVSVKQTDFPHQKLTSGLDFQHEIEQKAYSLSKQHATGRELPAMYVSEFLNGKITNKELPKTSSPSHIFKADFTSIFPKFIIEQLKDGIKHFNHSLPGFIADEAILIAPETRTSSPVTVLRDKETYLSTSHTGLYPCGEGSGHAGGITSAAVDGIKMAYAIVWQEKLLPQSKL